MFDIPSNLLATRKLYEIIVDEKKLELMKEFFKENNIIWEEYKL